MTAHTIHDLAQPHHRRCEPYRLRNCWLLILALSAVAWLAIAFVIGGM